ncbi:MAG: 4-(cytidine 5'-diphospho)-2-C-methyl-D-erythritol kinase [Eubacteriales bacterium]|nr:4-(cytidine 5'-diphospho)-2-C-methyl-D-erythritol kinase [Eubacteriales bacterium]
MEKHLTRNAYAKINIALDVAGRREDGYHLVDMVMQTVDLCDTLTFSLREDGEVRLRVLRESAQWELGGVEAYGPERTRVELGWDADGSWRLSRDSVCTVQGGTCMEDSSAGEVPDGADNLVCRAIEVMRREYGISQGVDVTLTKRIPVAAGMAGGSTDAAAAFLAVKELFDLPCSIEELERLATPLGADIPYCLRGGTMRAQGIGEILTPLPAAPDCALVVVKPDFAVSTPWCYREIDGKEITRRPDVEALIRALGKRDVERMWALADNVLEQATGEAYPVIGALEDFLLEKGARRAMMTGSGPTVFGVFDSRQEAQQVCGMLRRNPDYGKYEIFCTHLKNPETDKEA